MKQPINAQPRPPMCARVRRRHEADCDRIVELLQILWTAPLRLKQGKPIPEWWKGGDR